ncbi:hypothetical protein M231_00631 [Tremella mesenterica]|uniref:Uncharacterized protein n=1 Tax=Tremella mesenterica TaxID=5217 RepID=A0A4Q1BV33_TREME|nr:hypothetical protein M231_00631 [Tremella mesenterica]
MEVKFTAEQIINSLGKKSKLEELLLMKDSPSPSHAMSYILSHSLDYDPEGGRYQPAYDLEPNDRRGLVSYDLPWKVEDRLVQGDTRVLKLKLGFKALVTLPKEDEQGNRVVDEDKFGNEKHEDEKKEQEENEKDENKASSDRIRYVLSRYAV